MIPLIPSPGIPKTVSTPQSAMRPGVLADLGELGEQLICLRCEGSADLAHERGRLVLHMRREGRDLPGRDSLPGHLRQFG